MAAIKVPAFLARTMIHAHSASADVRQNGEKIVPEKHLIYVGNLAGAYYFTTVVKITLF